MATDYISRDKINEAFDSIWDCADMVFEPDDHCCAADDCGHCKWLQTKNAIKKKLDNIQPADVRPVVSAEWERPKCSTPRSWIFVCSKCGDRAYFPVPKYFPKGCGYKFCPNCGAEMEGRK